LFFFQSFSRSHRIIKSASRRTAGISVIQIIAHTMMDAAVTEVSAIPAVAAEGAAIKRRLFLFH
jgi:hypothetical protein